MAFGGGARRGAPYTPSPLCIAGPEGTHLPKWWSCVCCAVRVVLCVRGKLCLSLWTRGLWFLLPCLGWQRPASLNDEQRTPPPLAQTRARFWFQDQKCGNTGSPCLDKPVLARGTYCGTQVAGIAQPIVHDYERVSNRPAYTPEYKSTWNYSCSNTVSPILTLHASCTKL